MWPHTAGKPSANFSLGLLITADVDFHSWFRMEAVAAPSGSALWAPGKQVMGEKRPLAILVAEENEGWGGER